MRTVLAVAVCTLLALGLVPAGAQEVDPRPAFGDTSAPLRPGASLGGYCTFNFVFFDSEIDEEAGETPTGFIGTAAHCTDELDEVVQLDGYGAIGTVVYDSDLVSSNVDFALIELFDHVIADTNPTMRGFDGPYGSVVADDLSAGDLVSQHGYGMVLGENSLTRSRQGVLVDHTADEFVINGPFMPGDSGSAILHSETGKALGIISRFNFGERGASTDIGPLMGYIFNELDAAGFDDVVLADAG